MMLSQYRQWFMEILMVGGSEKTKPIKAKFTDSQRGRMKLIFRLTYGGELLDLTARGGGFAKPRLSM